MPSIGQTWVLASIGAVVEMGVLISTIETLLMESRYEEAPSLCQYYVERENFSGMF
jgi:hypothetical protein